jgi:hypothetical protein
MDKENPSVLLRLYSYFRRNVLALLALFVALGGTSYAAFDLPPGSVGTRQLRDRAVSAAKLDPSSVAATIRAWADFRWSSGRWNVQASTPDISISSGGTSEFVTWRHTRFARNCMPFVSVSTDVSFDLPRGLVQIGGIVAPDGTPSVGGIQMVIICPSPGSQRANRMLR